MAGDTLDLSPREREVFEMACRGMRQREIADRLGITRSTVSVYVRRIAGKLPSRPTRSPMHAIVLYALRSQTLAV